MPVALLRMAQQEGLDVILRPGPYVCAEWDAGGLPAWLFDAPMAKVRTPDPAFLAATDDYFRHLGEQVAPLMAARGGPVIAVQIENEYGGYGSDRDYLHRIQRSLVEAGMGSGLMFTSDGAGLLANDILDDVLAVVNFAPGQAQASFKTLAALRPHQPMMAGEYWGGWYDKVGEPHAHTDGAQQAKDLAWMLRQGYSFNIYMLDGGTNFGFTSGANITDPGQTPAHYVPLTTSYDYDAAIDEAGRPTAKYWLFRKAIAAATGTTPPAVPPPTPVDTVPAFTLGESASLWDNLPAPVHVDRPLPMEHFGQDRGYMLYRTPLHGPQRGMLDLGDVRDYAAVYLDGRRLGTVERRLRQRGLEITVPAGDHRLDVLVENAGRVNYGEAVADGRSGLVDPVTLAGKALRGWDVYPLPMRSPEKIRGWTHGKVAAPAFHRGAFTLDKPADTFWSMTAFDKGFVWVDGRNLGRFWRIGPQQALYQPGPWLEPGRNTMIVFDLTTPATPTVRGATNQAWSVPADISAP